MNAKPSISDSGCKVVHQVPKYITKMASRSLTSLVDNASRPHFTYFPFGGGPRLCIGNNFALMEAQLVLATIAQVYELRLVPHHPVVPEPLVTLRPRNGMLMTLHTRKTE